VAIGSIGGHKFGVHGQWRDKCPWGTEKKSGQETYREKQIVGNAREGKIKNGREWKECRSRKTKGESIENRRKEELEEMGFADQNLRNEGARKEGGCNWKSSA
jgi:hypothetical protein